MSSCLSQLSSYSVLSCPVYFLLNNNLIPLILVIILFHPVPSCPILFICSRITISSHSSWSSSCSLLSHLIYLLSNNNLILLISVIILFCPVLFICSQITILSRLSSCSVLSHLFALEYQYHPPYFGYHPVLSYPALFDLLSNNNLIPLISVIILFHPVPSHLFALK